VLRTPVGGVLDVRKSDPDLTFHTGGTEVLRIKADDGTILRYLPDREGPLVDALENARRMLADIMDGDFRPTRVEMEDVIGQIDAVLR